MIATRVAEPLPDVAAEPGLPAHWWGRAVALHERAVSLPPDRATDRPADGLAPPVARWRSEHGPALPRRLAELGLTEADLAWLLTESAAAVCARLARPSWVDTAEQAVRSAVAVVHPPSDWRDAFGLVMRPFVTGALDMVVAAADPRDDRDALARDLTARLTRRLVDLAAPTMVSELHRHRQEGLLGGSDGAGRFAGFVRTLTDPQGLAALLARYPVLARLLAVTASGAGSALAELLTRLRHDRPLLAARLLDGTDPGALVGVRTHLGDPHEGGRATAILHFADGRQILYKPRDLRCHLRLDAMLSWLNRRVPGLDLRRARTLARPGYGWSEYMAHTPLADTVGAQTFYRRQGALLALLHVLHAVDIHCENLIACGDQPVVIDVETLLHHPSAAELRDTGDPAADLLATSVHRTALLPLMAVGEEGILDMSGTGGDPGAVAPTSASVWIDAGTDRMRAGRGPVAYPGAANRPLLDGAPVDPGEYEPALLEGFRAAYDAMVAHRAEVSTLIERCARTTVRLIVRPTWIYQSLLVETVRPHLLGDALDRDRALGALWVGSADAYLAQFPRHEIVDLWRAEVPLLRTRPDDRRVWWGATPVGLIPACAPGAEVPMRPTGLAAALGKLADLGEPDRQDQEWVISATLATRRRPPGHARTPVVSGSPGPAVGPERLTAAACAVADQIVARGIPGPGRVNWLGLELVDDRQWLVLPMGAGLAQGYLGVALFLAQLAEITGVQRYADVAGRAVRAVPRLFDLLSARPDLVAAIGGGALHGFGGIAYALARLGGLLDDAELSAWTATAVDLAEQATRAHGDDPGTDWATGSAGCLAAMVAVRQATGLPAADRVARLCADQLVAQLDRPPGRRPVEPTGFAGGAAGVCFALTDYVRAMPDGPRVRRYARAADLAFARALPADDAEPTSPAWCGGSAGLALVLAQRGHPATGAWAHRLAGSPARSDLSMCHGESGIIDALVELSTMDHLGRESARRRAGAALDAVRWHRRGCGTPGAVDTPGLLTGLAGIGYALLRLAQPDRVPSALLVRHHPTTTTTTTTTEGDHDGRRVRTEPARG